MNIKPIKKYIHTHGCIYTNKFEHILVLTMCIETQENKIVPASHGTISVAVKKPYAWFEGTLHNLAGSIGNRQQSNES